MSDNRQTTDTGDDTRLYEGEHITCSNSHRIGVVVRTCRSGDPSTDWVDAIAWDIPKPSDGSPITCPRCGANWLFLVDLLANGTVTQKRGRICVDGQWRPPFDDLDRKHLANPGATITTDWDTIEREQDGQTT